MIRRKEWGHLEIELGAIVPDPKVRVGTGIGEGREALEVGVDAFPKVDRVIWGRLERENGLGDLDFRVSLHNGRGDNAEGRAATTTESLEQISVNAV